MTGLPPRVLNISEAKSNWQLHPAGETKPKKETNSVVVNPLSDFEDDKPLPCMYNPAHQIMPSRMQTHLDKCRWNHHRGRKRRCRYNLAHEVFEKELEWHLNICPNRIFNYGKSREEVNRVPPPEESRAIVPVRQITLSTEENWEEEVSPSYNPLIKLEKDSSLYVQARGGTKHEREEYRMKRSHDFNAKVDIKERKGNHGRHTRDSPRDRSIPESSRTSGSNVTDVDMYEESSMRQRNRENRQEYLELSQSSSHYGIKERKGNQEVRNHGRHTRDSPRDRSIHESSRTSGSNVTDVDMYEESSMRSNREKSNAVSTAMMRNHKTPRDPQTLDTHSDFRYSRVQDYDPSPTHSYNSFEKHVSSDLAHNRDKNVAAVNSSNLYVVPQLRCENGFSSSMTSNQNPWSRMESFDSSIRTAPHNAIYRHQTGDVSLNTFRAERVPGAHVSAGMEQAPQPRSIFEDTENISIGRGARRKIRE